MIRSRGVQIVKHKPVTRGVTELMYVGDDEAIEKSTAISPPRMAMAAAGLLAALCAKSGFVKAVGWGIVTDVVAEYLLAKTP